MSVSVVERLGDVGRGQAMYPITYRAYIREMALAEEKGGCIRCHFNDSGWKVCRMGGRGSSDPTCFSLASSHTHTYTHTHIASIETWRTNLICIRGYVGHSDRPMSLSPIRRERGGKDQIGLGDGLLRLCPNPPSAPRHIHKNSLRLEKESDSCVRGEGKTGRRGTEPSSSFSY